MSQFLVRVQRQGISRVIGRYPTKAEAAAVFERERAKAERQKTPRWLPTIIEVAEGRSRRKLPPGQMRRKRR